MSPSPNHHRIALAHDWLVGMRGGERVLERLAHLFGPTDLYTLVRDSSDLPPSLAQCRIVTSPLQLLPGAAGTWRRHYLPLMPWAVGQIRVRPCDLLISTSSAVMKSIKPPHGVPHLCYCHTPARYIWEQTDDYALGSGGKLRSLGLRAIRTRFQNWDRRTANRVTKFLANSHHTARRIQRCYGREARVVHPPVRTEFFGIDERVPREDWLLVVAALEPYKRIDLVIDAVSEAGLPLKIVGDGSQRHSLEAMAGRTVQFLGRVDDAKLREMYRRARALVFPQVEDFGIIAAEAQACGCPVIAFAGGGAQEIITESTGTFFHEQSPHALRDAVIRFDSKRFSAQACRHNALRFSESEFDAQIITIVREMLPHA